MKNNLVGKRILITAGPTWVPLDKVRVITNIFGGALGVEIAKSALLEGAEVTLLFGPGKAQLPNEHENLNVIKYKFYDELLHLMQDEVKSGMYDAVIHSAAVADYAPVDVEPGKIKSGNDELVIHLKPTIKIVDLIKKIDPNIFLVKFKLEVDVTDDELINIAHKSLIQSQADLIVANEFSTVSNNHKAYIINKKREYIAVERKKNIASKVIKEVISKLNNS